MNEPDTTERSSRRNFLRRAGAVSGSLAASAVVGATPALAAERGRGRKRRRRAFYRLGPNEPFYHCPPVGGGDCSGCKACHAHAKNKLFPSARAANLHRAHKGCRCGVFRAGTLDNETWLKLFGPHSHRRAQVDRRRRRTRRILRGALRKAADAPSLVNARE